MDLAISGRNSGYAVFDGNGRYALNGGVNISASASTLSNLYEVDGFTVKSDDIIAKLGSGAKYIMFSSLHDRLSTLTVRSPAYETYESLTSKIDEISSTGDDSYDYVYEDVTGQLSAYKVASKYIQATRIVSGSSAYVLSGPFSAFEGLYASGSNQQ